MDQGYIIEQLKEAQIKVKELSREWDLSEAEFAKALKRICFDDKPVLFTGKSKELERFLYNGVFSESFIVAQCRIKTISF